MTGLIGLVDRAEIADLSSRYALVVDQREFSRLGEVFTADAVLDTGRVQRQGLAEIIAAMEGLHRYEATSHIMGQQLLELIDGEVRGVSYCEAHHLVVADDERIDRVMHIRYHDLFAQVVDGWRIARRRLVTVWTAEQRV